jgi:type VI secretion system secreted protein Hcp
MRPGLNALPWVAASAVLAIAACDGSPTDTEPPDVSPDPAELRLACATGVDAVSEFLGLDAPGGGTAAAVDYYLKLEGIDGESEAAGHEDEIEILSWSWGMALNGETRETDGTPTTVSLAGGMVVTIPQSETSRTLKDAHEQEEPIPEITMTLRKAEGDGDYLAIELKDVLVSSVTESQAGDQAPSEQMSLNYEEVKVTYDADMTCGGASNAVATFLGLDITRDESAATYAAYIKFDGIDGESQHQGHEEELDVLSFSWLTVIEVDAAGASGGSSATSRSALVLEKQPGASSQPLTEAARDENEFPWVTLSLYDASGDPSVDPLLVTFEDVVVESIETLIDDTAGLEIERVTVSWKGKVEYEWKVEEGDT